MILVDTSVWIDHIRRGDAHLAGLLDKGLVLSHPFVIGELAVGNLPQRARWLRILQKLPSTVTARHAEIMSMIEQHRLHGRGVGYADLHLVAAARISGAQLWTRDKRLAAVTHELGVAHPSA